LRWQYLNPRVGKCGVHERGCRALSANGLEHGAQKCVAGAGHAATDDDMVDAERQYESTNRAREALCEQRRELARQRIALLSGAEDIR
jgi:hypothetical protein